ncbi:MAG: alpha/beta family hydrolase [Planctomycetota bacterium]
MTQFIYNGKKSSELTFAFAHGAGAGMDTPFMETFAEGIADEGFRVARFEFPYMATIRDTGKRRAPDRAPKLIACWQEVIEELSGKGKLVIGGKSMGGRIASLVADEAEVDGLVCLGYPFHPVGKPDKLRTEHLEKLKTKTLIVQGERDGFGKVEEVEGYALSRKIKIAWLPDGDHSFKPRKSSGHTLEGNWEQGVEQTVKFLKKL